MGCTIYHLGTAHLPMFDAEWLLLLLHKVDLVDIVDTIVDIR